jgi:hypothetical protein
MQVYRFMKITNLESFCYWPGDIRSAQAATRKSSKRRYPSIAKRMDSGCRNSRLG